MLHVPVGCRLGVCPVAASVDGFGLTRGTEKIFLLPSPFFTTVLYSIIYYLISSKLYLIRLPFTLRKSKPNHNGQRWQWCVPSRRSRRQNVSVILKYSSPFRWYLIFEVITIYGQNEKKKQKNRKNIKLIKFIIKMYCYFNLLNIKIYN